MGKGGRAGSKVRWREGNNEEAKVRAWNVWGWVGKGLKRREGK